MKVLVVGGTRFLGHELAWRLLFAGHEVTLFNRGREADAFGGRVERLRGDRTTVDFDHLLHGRTFDAAVDFAAYTADDARRVVSTLAGSVGHYVVISSGQVYLVREGAPRPAKEEDYDGPLLPVPPDPADKREWDYGMGKRALEDVLAEAWEKGRFPSTRVRLPMVNGERDHNRRLEGYLWRILDGGPLIVPDGGDRPMRHVYSGSAAKAILGLLGEARALGRAYNLAQDETPTLVELLTTTAELLGAPARLRPVAAKDLVAAGLPPVRVSPFSGRWMSFVDPARAKAELGFRHEPLRSYLDKIVAAFLASPPRDTPPAYADRAREKALLARL
ncbi:MAG TPA: NAD-dependent epimerase/dehydratase family protein [Vicinamibacteria bacterium]